MYRTLAAATLIASILTAGPAFAQYRQTNLVSDGTVGALNIDPQLKNPWGVSFTPTGPFWVSDNNSGVSTLYNSSGVKQGLVVSVANSTGQIFNTDTTGFYVTGTTASKFIFAGDDGKISAWASGSAAAVKVDNSTAGASYNGIAENSTGGQVYIYAANTAKGTIDVFDTTFAPVTTLAGSFASGLPAGYVPFNIQTLNGKLYVAYANFATYSGAVAEFNPDGTFIKLVAKDGTLAEPWGLDIAPSTFGAYANDLLVGNFYTGTINAYDPNTNAYLGQLADQSGKTLVEPSLWALVNGNGGNAGSTQTVYFTAGLANEQGGLLGALSVPEPGSAAVVMSGLAALALLRRRRA